MDFIKNLQNKPENVKKRILWAIVITVAILMAIWWIVRTGNILKNITGEDIDRDFNTAGIKKILENKPDFSIPEKETKKLEQMMNK